MALCGVSRVDDLNAGAATASPIVPGDPDVESVGVIQDLLTGQGQKGLPNLLSPVYGSFGPLTSAAVQGFRTQQSLSAGNQVDSKTLQSLVQSPATAPIASRGYLSLTLNFAYSGLAKILSMVAQMEGGGWEVSDWSPDGKQLLATNGVSTISKAAVFCPWIR